MDAWANREMGRKKEYGRRWSSYTAFFLFVEKPKMFVISLVKPTRCIYASNLFYCLLASKQQYLSDICLLQYVQSLTSDDGRKDRPKHVECYSNKINLRHWCIWLVLL